MLFTGLLLLTSLQVGAGVFGFFNKQDFLLSPAIEGKLLEKGKPIVGQTIMRRLHYGKQYIDKTVSDSQGHFSFPRWSIKTSKPNQMFDGDSLSQHIYIQQKNSEELMLWMANFFFYEDQNSIVLEKMLTGLNCDISKQAATYDIIPPENTEHEFVVYTLCEIER